MAQHLSGHRMVKTKTTLLDLQKMNWKTLCKQSTSYSNTSLQWGIFFINSIRNMCAFIIHQIIVFAPFMCVLPACYPSATYRFSAILTNSEVKEKPRKTDVCVVLWVL